MIYVTRREHFSAAHRLHNPKWSGEKNRDTYGKCNNPNGHGHNYIVEVTIAGITPDASGMVIDLKKLSGIIRTEIIDKVDHRHLNHDVDVLHGIIPTAENLAIAFWRLLNTGILQGKVHSVRLYESENNFAEYRVS
ncbi:MAG TPA: 6-carboxytetrahydropterin synthase [Saprospiraceae bacterium]|nr:6-carboxytetrahydropterin synthase [Saprospiraceae bacterium]